MTSCVRVLSTQTLDSFPSILLVSRNGKKIIVNCGEGCQRVFLEFGQKISTVDRICLTHLGHETIGGLPGMILTTSDVVKQATENARSMSKNDRIALPRLSIIGPHGTHKFIRSLRHFMRRDSFRIKVQEGVYKQGEINCEINGNSNSTNRSKKEKRAKEDNNDHTDDNSFLVQSIVAYTKFTATDSTNLSNKSEHSDDTIYQSKKRPRTTEAAKENHTILTPHETQKSCSYSSNQKSKQQQSQRQQQQHYSSQVLSFLFTTPPIPGKFLIKKAEALGIPKGPLYGQLKAGKTITFPHPSSINNSSDELQTVTVKSHQVVEPGNPGVVVAVLCYPNFDVLNQLQNSHEMKQFQQQGKDTSNNDQNDTIETKLELIVHMTSQYIFDSDICNIWRKLFFGSCVRHLFVRIETATGIDQQHAVTAPCDDSESLSPFHSAHFGAQLRSRVCSYVYRSPVQEETLMPPDIEREESKVEESDVVHAVPLLEYVLLPRTKRGFQNADMCNQQWKELKNDAQILLNTSGCLDRANQVLEKCKLLPDTNDLLTNHCIGGEILFTGTGSAVPCKHRNVSGIYVRMENGNSMLLDVGEGTIGQLLRAKQHQKYRGVGEESLAVVLKNIKAVWISHPHADHHLGIIRLLEERARLLSDHDPIVLIAPPSILSFLKEYELIKPRVAGSYTFLDCRALTTYNSNNSQEIFPNHASLALQRLKKDLGIQSCTTIPVAHCSHSFAVVFHGTAFGSLAYSGDCRPSESFAEIAYNADVLIHEATFADGMEADAVVKRHCTVGEALRIASKMNAKTTVLTHFSQRYPKIPLLQSIAPNIIPITNLTMDSASSSPPTMIVIPAFDFMIITPTNIASAAMLTPVLQLLYTDDTIEDDAIEKSDAQSALEVPGLFAQSELL
mmetsp:Transcript_42264/g.47210  ORF Transcript_42264/g.47210 Transcript_42264/m.47210 type:complete len:900 (-) Transcript_42264:115-2814(-)